MLVKENGKKPEEAGKDIKPQEKRGPKGGWKGIGR